MTDKELSIAIREIGLAHGMCDKYSGRWREDYTQDELIGLFISGQDFCVEHDFPPLAFIKENFSKEVLDAHHVYIDYKGNLEITESGTYIFLGDGNITAEVSGFAVVDLYARHNTILRTVSRENAKVFVTMCDNSSFHGAEVYDSSTIKAYNNRKKKEGD